ncbi:MAG: hypothetical protein GAK45_02317 [Pseudomonas citronellolis]|nr:MAG: hypothetical protein GAK45_02317 [Pseudomonas citronellolis]
MRPNHETAQQLLRNAFPQFALAFETRPDDGLSCAFHQRSGERLFCRVLSVDDLRDQRLFSDMVGRIQRDLILAAGPLPDQQVPAFSKRIPLPTFYVGQSRHRQRKVVHAGKQLRRLAGMG